MATHPTRSTGAGHAVTAGFLGWTLDAFDFFIVIFLLDTLAAQFHVAKSQILWSITATLALRPVGALIFGILADRYGRRLPLIANVVFFSAIEFACGFVPSFTVFIILRALYGIGMGGEWGVGASLAMETAPPRWRGLLSGVLQSGYSIGYLLAALAARFVLPQLGWRWMFWLGGLPALLALYIRAQVPESEAWKAHRLPRIRQIAASVTAQWKLMAYLLVTMTLFMFLSHGTQDLYPDFLKNEHHIAPTLVADIAVFYNIGAVVGSIFFGHLSQRIGRRYAIVAALGLALAVVPIWTFAAGPLKLALGAFLMQVGVQGAWGIVPAHLNEISPDAVRGLVPGLAYQLGILFAAPTSNIEHALQLRMGYEWALAAFEIAVIIGLAIAVLAGREQHGKSFVDA